MGEIGFRPLGRDDLGLMYEWLRGEHVRRWWDQHESYEDVAEHYLPAIEGRRAVDLHLILVGSSRVDLQACKLEYSIVSPK